MSHKDHVRTKILILYWHKEYDAQTPNKVDSRKQRAIRVRRVRASDLNDVSKNEMSIARCHFSFYDG